MDWLKEGLFSIRSIRIYLASTRSRNGVCSAQLIQDMLSSWSLFTIRMIMTDGSRLRVGECT